MANVVMLYWRLKEGYAWQSAIDDMLLPTPLPLKPRRHLRSVSQPFHI